MYQLTQFKNRPIRRILTAVALVVGALTAAPALATPPSPSPYLVTEIISHCNVGELDIFAKTDIDPSVATYFWKLRVDSKGATDLYVVRNTFQPGASTGWHTHPGPSLITGVSGTEPRQGHASPTSAAARSICSATKGPSQL